MKISCNIIRDLLPLYAEDLASEDTRALVDEHLHECEDCTNVLNTIKQGTPVPVERAPESLNKVKKIIRDNHKEFTAEKKAEIMKEIGDVLWYCATLSHDLGYTLDEVAQTNVDKLRSRMERQKITGSGDNR